MAWSLLSLANPSSNAAGLTHGLQVFSVTPWTYSVKEGHGLHSWLSFSNAVSAVIDRVDINQPVFIIALTSSSMAGFAQQCSALQAVFPLKYFSQWQRHADALTTIEIDKFDLKNTTPDVRSITINAVPSVALHVEKAMAQSASSNAAAMTSADPLSELSSFEGRKAVADGDVSSPLPALSGGSGFRFYAQSDIANQLRAHGVGDNNTVTAMLVFSGTSQQLDFLREVMP